MNKVHKYINKLLEALTIESVIALCTWTLGITLAYLLPKITAEFNSLINQIKWPLSIIIGLVFTIYFLQYYRNRSMFLPQFPKFNFNFIWHEYEITHKYINITHIVHTRRYKIEALKDGLTTFNERFFWTGGDENYSIKCLSKGHTLSFLQKENLFNHYAVSFGRTLRKGDIEEVIIEWQLHDPEKKAQPFISTPIKEPTLKLKLVVIFPELMNVQEIAKEISFPHGRKIPIYFKSEIVENGIFKWESSKKSKPKLFYHYEIRWIFVV